MINNLKVLALIPARGGSKRIPDKNIKELCGKPLISYAIEQSKNSKYVDRVLVSTDYENIRNISLKYGAEVPFLRPAEISGDKSTDYEAFFHAICWLKDNENYTPDIIVQIRPTSPLRTTDQIDLALEYFIANKDADSLRTVTRPEQHPYKMYKTNEKGYLEPLFVLAGQSDAFNLSEQMLPKCFKHVGYIDIMWTKTITEKKSMTGDNILPFFIEDAVSGINNQESWDYYEYLMSKKK
jgi:N-acylneuraminate cytidylyltransferase